MPQFSIFLSATLSRIACIPADCLLSLTISRSNIFEASEASIFLRWFNVHFDKLAQIDNDIPTDSPSTGAISTSLDGESERILIAE